MPVELDNEPEYRLAERDVVAWLREQPLDLRELDAKVAAALRAERLAQLDDAAAAGRARQARTPRWPGSTTSCASGEPLVVFARHARSRGRCSSASRDALHLLGRDTIAGARRGRPRLPGPRTARS